MPPKKVGMSDAVAAFIERWRHSGAAARNTFSLGVNAGFGDFAGVKKARVA
jgi:hypothetical protein